VQTSPDAQSLGWVHQKRWPLHLAAATHCRAASSLAQQTESGTTHVSPPHAIRWLRCGSHEPPSHVAPGVLHVDESMHASATSHEWTPSPWRGSHARCCSVVGPSHCVQHTSSAPQSLESSHACATA
jgi:hypothetical protein